MRRRLRLFGPRGLMGIGVHLSHIQHTLAQFQGVFTSIEHFHDRVVDEVREAIKSSLPTDINLFFGDVEFAEALKGVKLFWTVFESSRPPPGSIQWLDRYDLLLSPSAWGKDCLIAEGLDASRIVVVPEGVDPFRFHPFSRHAGDLVQERPCRFLMMGKYETRKAYEQAFAAFDLAFGDSRSVELLIKPEWISESRVMMAPDCLALMKRYQHLPLRWVRGLLSVQALSALYADVDVFLFPSMGEGWGLPLIEAIACGTPALCTTWSGQSEYLKGIEHCIWPIQCQLQDVACPRWLSDHVYDDAVLPQWAVPDVHDLAGQMQMLAKMERAERERLARCASDYVRREFTWIQAADKLINLIRKL